MGQISISVSGSFLSSKKPTNSSKTFSAMQHGHAHAVAEAIAWLSNDVMPAAIANDHECHTDGHMPDGGFSKP
jgi:hypothetical protein